MNKDKPKISLNTNDSMRLMVQNGKVIFKMINNK